jgi:hypothetical protein
MRHKEYFPLSTDSFAPTIEHLMQNDTAADTEAN